MFKILKSLLLICILSLSIFASGQTIVVKKETARVKSQSAEGFEVELHSTYDEAESALEKQMKSFGKVKQVENYWVVSAPTIQGTAYTTPVYGITKQVGNVISIWVGLIGSEWNQNDSEVVSKDLESVLRSFGVNFHRDKIQKQIDESLRASQAVDRQQQRLANQNRDLNSRVEDNKREKIELEQSLVNNKIELETLLKKIEKNKKDQDSVAVAGEQVRKVVEMHRERQRKIN